MTASWRTPADPAHRPPDQRRICLSAFPSSCLPKTRRSSHVLRLRRARLAYPPNCPCPVRQSLTGRAALQTLRSDEARRDGDGFRQHFSPIWLDRGGAEGDLMELTGFCPPPSPRSSALSTPRGFSWSRSSGPIAGDLIPIRSGPIP
jgi:hypothetical protein